MLQSSCRTITDVDKQKILDAIVEALTREMDALTAAAKAAFEAATNSESKAEDQYDTRGLEASYLAGAQAERVAALKRLIAIYKYLPVRDAATGAPIELGSLVEVQSNGKSALYFLVNQGGGISVQVQGKTIQVITPNAPLGEALLDRKAGDTIEVEQRGSTREYRIVRTQ